MDQPRPRSRSRSESPTWSEIRAENAAMQRAFQASPMEWLQLQSMVLTLEGMHGGWHLQTWLDTIGFRVPAHAVQLRDFRLGAIPPTANSPAMRIDMLLGDLRALKRAAMTEMVTVPHHEIEFYAISNHALQKYDLPRLRAASEALRIASMRGPTAVCPYYTAREVVCIVYAVCRVPGKTIADYLGLPPARPRPRAKKPRVAPEAATNIQSFSMQNQCGICLGGVDADQRTGVLPCKHLFHLACIEEWYKRSKTCPMCRGT